MPRHVATALLAALYCLAAGSLCFTITGTDPIDAIVTPQRVPIRLTVLGAMAACIAVFASIGKCAGNGGEAVADDKVRRGTSASIGRWLIKAGLEEWETPGAV